MTGTLRRNGNGLVFAFAALFLAFAPARAEVSPGAPAPGYLEKAAAALADSDRDEAWFWIACYMGEVLRKGERAFRDEEFAALIERLDPKPTAFLSGRVDQSFLDFFMMGSWSLWDCAGAPMDAARHRILMAEIRFGSRYVAFWGRPTLEVRILIGGAFSMTRMLLTPSEETRIVIGRYGDEGEPLPEADQAFDIGPVQFIVDAGVRDIDDDGEPELMVRYNRPTVSGFTQVLDIFGPDGAGGFARRFRFEGEAEGYARRLDDGRIEVARGFNGKGGGHLGNDRERVELWRFRNGRPVKESVHTTPHRLLGKGWEAYYLSQ